VGDIRFGLFKLYVLFLNYVMSKTPIQVLLIVSKSNVDEVSMLETLGEL